jgi:acyl-CoA synthetase (AMP-forming)/AMP-acid ligase II
MPKFDPVAFCKTVETYKVTVGLIVPPILVVLARHPGKLLRALTILECLLQKDSSLTCSAAAQFNLKTLRILVSGAAPLGAPLVKAVTERLKSFGNVTPITQGTILEDLLDE